MPFPTVIWPWRYNGTEPGMRTNRTLTYGEPAPYESSVPLGLLQNPRALFRAPAGTLGLGAEKILLSLESREP